MYVKLSIPERLKDLRVERHLTLEQLAEATGLSKSALGSYEGSKEEAQVRLFCRQLGIDYDSMSKEEFTVIIGVLKKSSLLKGPRNKRGQNKKRK